MAHCGVTQDGTVLEIFWLTDQRSNHNVQIIYRQGVFLLLSISAHFSTHTSQVRCERAWQINFQVCKLGNEARKFISMFELSGVLTTVH